MILISRPAGKIGDQLGKVARAGITREASKRKYSWVGPGLGEASSKDKEEDSMAALAGCVTGYG